MNVSLLVIFLQAICTGMFPCFFIGLFYIIHTIYYILHTTYDRICAIYNALYTTYYIQGFLCATNNGDRGYDVDKDHEVVKTLQSAKMVPKWAKQAKHDKK